MKRVYTIRDVSHITGLDKRTIKYYIERGMIQPSDKMIQGAKETWLYSEADVIKVRQIALYRQLGYSADKIRKMILSPGFDWENVLDEQIGELKQKKRHLENAIFVAECMRYANEAEHRWIAFDSSDFNNDIDQFAVDCFADNDDELVEQGMKKINHELTEGLNAGDIEKQAQKVTELFKQLRTVLKYEPQDAKVQTVISEILRFMGMTAQPSKSSTQDILLGARLFSNMSFERVVDGLFSKQGATDFLLQALQVYCESLDRDRSKKDE